MSITKKIGTFLGVSSAKIISKNLSENLRYIINKTSLNPFDSDELNPGEDEYIEEKLRREKERIFRSQQCSLPKKEISPMKRSVKTWSKDDLWSVMNSMNYQYDSDVQEKVKKYFDYKYPGYQRLDATGRQIRD